MAVEHVDVLIVGAGISGLGAAVHLQKLCPGKSFAIMERRENFGGKAFANALSPNPLVYFGIARCHWRHLGFVSLSRHPL
jgi:cation diffusion facilitator CzcD-associated flavoprotein CzcO